MTRLTFYPIFDSYATVVVVALLLLGLLAVRPGRTGLSGSRWAALVGLRLAVAALVLLAMLRPTVVRTEIKRQSATLIVLLDRSRSMTVRDALGDKSRWEMLRETLADAGGELGRLADDFELKAYTFDAGLNSLEVEGGEIALPEKPDGEQTAIGHALEEALQREAGKRLLGVVLLSDGAQRAYAPRDLPPQTAAARLKAQGCPLFTLALGQSVGLGQAQDVAVTELLVNPSVFVKNELPVAATVRADGYAGSDIPVELLFETAAGKMEVVAREKLKATADGKPLAVRLRYAPELPGEYKLTLRVAEQPGELVTTNNELSTFVNVLKGGLNVLYLEGAPPRVEQKFLGRALAASPDIHVDFPRPPIDPARPETRPGDLSERFEPGKYEVYILGDLDAKAFEGTEDLERLAEAVERGAGLLALGGFHSFGPGGYATAPLADVLPVKMDRFARQSLDGTIRTDVHLTGKLTMRPTRVGLLHFALLLAGGREENLALWSRLPPLTGANRFREVKPGALVLAEAQNGAPLLVADTYGNGRVMAFAGDSTWRWWLKGHEAAHKRLWRQVVLWLARKDQATDGNVWVRLPKRRYAPGSRVEFTVGAQSPSGDPLPDAQFKAEVVLPDGKRRPVDLVRQGDERIGSFRDTQTDGDYAIEVTATHEDLPAGNARSRFLVFEQDLELDNAAADEDSLESLAAMTGGESLAPEQLPALIERLATQTEHLEIERETKKTFWDSWPFLLLVVGLLGVEWFLRKRWGLV